MTRRHLFTALFTGATAAGALHGGHGAQGVTPPVLVGGVAPVPVPYPWIPPVFGSPVEAAVIQPDGTWRLSRLPASTVLVVLNGLVMQPGVDYNLDGQAITFVAGVQDTYPDDWVGAVYQ